QPVRHLGLGWEGVLQKLEGDRAEVLVRGKRVRARTTELGGVPAAEAIREGSAPSRARAAAQGAAGRRLAAHPASGRQGAAAAGGDLDESIAVAPEINLIGV